MPAGRIDKELERLNHQEKRFIDAYRKQVITLEELGERKSVIAEKRKFLGNKKAAVLSQLEGSGQPQITMEMLGGSAPFCAG